MNDTPTIADLKAKQQRLNELAGRIVEKRQSDASASIDAELAEIDALKAVLSRYSYFIYAYVETLETALGELVSDNDVYDYDARWERYGCPWCVAQGADPDTIPHDDACPFRRARHLLGIDALP